jgi:hypothetical protein
MKEVCTDYTCTLLHIALNKHAGYFQPRRRAIEDANVVCHVPFLILKNDCHINVEYSGSVTLFQYLYKYFYKGPDEANWTVQKENTKFVGSGYRKPIDEIKDYERGRYLSSLEAATRIAGYHISKKHPGVDRLPIHMPNRGFAQMKRKTDSQSTATLLIRYLDRPRREKLDELTYAEFGTQCYLVTHDPLKPLHPLEILENIHPRRPQMRIRFYEEKHVGIELRRERFESTKV